VTNKQEMNAVPRLLSTERAHKQDAVVEAQAVLLESYGTYLAPYHGIG
jgi:hypothetical protein